MTENKNKIPWAKPCIGYEELEEVTDTIRSGWVSMGPKVKKLEENFSKYFDIKHSIAVNNGTSALDVALKALDVKQGDEIIVPALTYIATTNAVSYQYAKPILADVEEDTYNISADDILERITKKTKYIISIDYGGLPSNYIALKEICEDYKLNLIVDGAHSIGSYYKGINPCKYGIISTISMHAAKVMTSVEGGMVFTDDSKLAERCKIIRNQGEDPYLKYNHILLGNNYRMSELHAAIGLAQFRKLPSILEKRQELANNYMNLLGNNIAKFQKIPNDCIHARFLFSVLLNDRDKIADHLLEKGIETRCWIPIYRQPIYKDYFKNCEYPNTEKISKEILNLPMYYDMRLSDQERIASMIKESYKEKLFQKITT